MQSIFLEFTQTIITAIMVGMVGVLVHSLLKKVESMVAAHSSPDMAAKVNAMLDTVERLTEAAVQDTNSRIVIGLKQKNLFTTETANAVKVSAINTVLENLGPLKDEAVALLGPIEGIVGQMVEKYVLKWKDQVNQTIINSAADQTAPPIPQATPASVDPAELPGQTWGAQSMPAEQLG
ncbi:hypothetical protein PP175_12440 [Aneurinibacillus sp. Ricciae_BoGa-3]|uniref:hypothetical protein n=1 Tax=Aneurinibacillus sp. Ricciae_BoGa-3 TaxID=3022697 RepID=UPI00233F9C1E|nr:hypothetical protein [Aneurinibacillus sp. Ricciae_BoGa-3]WCK56646.1 hypothetical protein PP175_12440 [Aneurinibacillus sp. Ricciae_BoGa-3]